MCTQSGVTTICVLSKNKKISQFSIRIFAVINFYKFIFHTKMNWFTVVRVTEYNYQANSLYVHQYKDMSLVVRKPAFCICENKDADQLRGNREADQRLCFRYHIVQSLYFLNPKFQASSHLLWLYSLVCVGPGRKPRRPVFSERGSYVTLPLILAEDLWMVWWVCLILTVLVLEDHWREEWPSYPRRMPLAGCTFQGFLTDVWK